MKPILLISSYAACYYSYIQPNGVMDIWIETSTEIAEKLVNALHEFGFQDKAVDKEIFLTPARS